MPTKLEKELKEVNDSLQMALAVVNKKLNDSQETIRKTYADCTDISKSLKFMTEERDKCMINIRDLLKEVSILKNSLTSSYDQSSFLEKSVNKLEVKCSKQSEIIKSLTEIVNLMVNMESSHG